MILAAYDANGKITGFYRPDLHQNIPEPNAEISEDDWRGHIEGKMEWRFDESGQQYEYTPPAQPRYPTLEIAQRAMVAWINSFAADLTVGMPDAELRALPVKGAAARAYLDGTATTEQLGILQAEAGLTGEEVDALAAKIKANADRDDQVNAKISGLRRALKLQLEAVEDPFGYEPILQAGRVQAVSLAAELGLTPAA